MISFGPLINLLFMLIKVPNFIVSGAYIPKWIKYLSKSPGKYKTIAYTTNLVNLVVKKKWLISKLTVLL